MVPPADAELMLATDSDGAREVAQPRRRAASKRAAVLGGIAAVLGAALALAALTGTFARGATPTVTDPLPSRFAQLAEQVVVAAAAPAAAGVAAAAPAAAAPADGARGGFLGDVANAAKNMLFLEHAQKKYSEPLARAFAALAKLAYCAPLPGIYGNAVLSCNAGNVENQTSPCEAATFSLTPGLVRLIFPTEGQEAVSAYLARLQPSNTSKLAPGVVLVLRGSLQNSECGIRDNMTELEGTVAGADKAKVHAGFAKSYQVMAAQIKQYLTELWCYPKQTGPLLPGEMPKEPCTVYITGHGVGGAIGALAAWDLVASNYTVGPSYLFESPKVGNAAFAGALWGTFSGLLGAPGPLYVVTSNQDATPRWPRLPGYASFGVEVHYGQGLKKPQVCVAGKAGCGVAKYTLAKLTTKDLCPSTLAPDGDFCNFPSFGKQCYAGLPYKTAAALPIAVPEVAQPEEAQAATWYS